MNRKSPLMKRTPRHTLVTFTATLLLAQLASLQGADASPADHAPGSNSQSGPDEIIRTDVCVYGATPAEIVAAVAAKQEGCTVVLVEPSRWVGGILGAGIKPKQDCPEPRAVGGLTKTKVFNAGEDPPSIRASLARWLKEE